MISLIAFVEVSTAIIRGIVELKLFNEKPYMLVLFSTESSPFEMVGFGVVNVSTVVLISDSWLEQSASSDPSPQLLLPSQI